MIAVFLWLEHLLIKAVGNLILINTDSCRTLAVYVCIPRTTTIVLEVIVAAVDNHTGTNLRQSPLLCEIALRRKLIEHNNFAIAINLVTHSHRSIDLHATSHGHGNLILVRIGIQLDLYFAEPIWCTCILALFVPICSGIIISLGAVDALLWTGSHHKLTVQLIAVNGTLFLIQYDFKLLLLIGCTCQNHIASLFFHAFKCRNLLNIHAWLLCPLCKVQFKLFMRNFKSSLCAPVYILFQLDTEIKEIIISGNRRKVRQNACQINGNLFRIGIDGQPLHCSQIAGHGLLCQRLIAIAVLVNRPGNVKCTQRCIFILIDHLYRYGICWCNIRICKIEVYLLVYLLCLLELWTRGMVCIHKTISAECIVVVLLINPISAIAPKFIRSIISIDSTDRLVNIIPNKAAIDIISIANHVPMLLCIAIGLTHCVVILRMYIGLHIVIGIYAARQCILGTMQVNDILDTRFQRPRVSCLNLLLIGRGTFTLSKTGGVTL